MGSRSAATTFSRILRARRSSISNERPWPLSNQKSMKNIGKSMRKPSKKHGIYMNFHGNPRKSHENRLQNGHGAGPRALPRRASCSAPGPPAAAAGRDAAPPLSEAFRLKVNGRRRIEFLWFFMTFHDFSVGFRWFSWCFTHFPVVFPCVSL